MGGDKRAIYITIMALSLILLLAVLSPVSSAQEEVPTDRGYQKQAVSYQFDTGVEGGLVVALSNMGNSRLGLRVHEAGVGLVDMTIIGAQLFFDLESLTVYPSGIDNSYVLHVSGGKQLLKGCDDSDTDAIVAQEHVELFIRADTVEWQVQGWDDRCMPFFAQWHTSAQDSFSFTEAIDGFASEQPLDTYPALPR